MKRAILFPLAGVLTALMGQVLICASAVAGPEEVFIREVQSTLQCWQYSGVELPEGYVATITASGKWQTSPKHGQVGAGGYNQKAGPTSVRPGARTFCLLVRAGDSVVAFSNDDQTMRIKTPGRIHFCVNDEPTKAGAQSGRDCIHALPIPTKGTSLGFSDNVGALMVRIGVQRND